MRYRIWLYEEQPSHQPQLYPLYQAEGGKPAMGKRRSDCYVLYNIDYRVHDNVTSGAGYCRQEKEENRCNTWPETSDATTALRASVSHIVRCFKCARFGSSCFTIMNKQRRPVPCLIFITSLSFSHFRGFDLMLASIQA